MELLDTNLVTLLAAGIAAVVTLAGLLIAKDQKTTEFRQKWIDKLREDVAAFLACVTTLSYEVAARGIHPKDSQELQHYILSNMRSELLRGEELHSRIILRLNPKEHGDLIGLLDALRSAMGSDELLDPVSFSEREEHIASMFQSELKKEWKRVKSGEPFFRAMRVFLTIVVVGAVAATCAVIYTRIS